MVISKEQTRTLNMAQNKAFKPIFAVIFDYLNDQNSNNS